MEANTIAWVTLTIVVLTFLVYALQWHVMRRGLKTQNFWSLVLHLQSHEMRSARQQVLGALSTKRYEEWRPENKEVAATAIAGYQVAAVAIQQGIVDPAPVVASWRASIVRC